MCKRKNKRNRTREGIEAASFKSPNNSRVTSNQFGVADAILTQSRLLEAEKNKAGCDRCGVYGEKLYSLGVGRSGMVCSGCLLPTQKDLPNTPIDDRTSKVGGGKVYKLIACFICGTSQG